MTLYHGDAIKTECDRLGPFPSGVVKGYNSLQLQKDSALRGKLFLTSRRDDYKEEFKETWSEGNENWESKICYNKFGDNNTPLICSLKKEKQTTSGGETTWMPMADAYGVGSYTVSTVGPLMYTSDAWRYTWQSYKPVDDGIVVPPSFRESGTISYDLYNGPYITYSIYQPGIMGSFYMNQAFGCRVDISFNIVNYPDYKTATLSYTATMTITNDAGTVTLTKTGSGSTSHLITFSHNSSVPWKSKGRSGSLSKSMSFSGRLDMYYYEIPINK